MESNREEATRCLAIAQKHFSAANYPSARKFAQKSISLFETPQAVRLLASINTAAAAESANGNGAEPSTSTSTETHPSAAGAKHRNVNGAGSSSNGKGNGTAGGIGGEKREYTAEQATVVRRVRGCKVTEYYEILSVKRDCEEAEIKKAYRKVRRFFYTIFLH
jgi:DnaJ family protein B protein 12